VIRFREILLDAWYLPRLTPIAALLLPFALVFALAAALRRACYRVGLLARQSIGIPVVVVGNITVGGTGKTPLVLAIAHALRERGWTPGIVSRGYRAVITVPRQVDSGAAPDLVGDEPLLLAAAGFPVWIGFDRVAAARALIAAHPQVNVLICDDGLQHYALGRDVEIAVIDAERGLGNGCLLPAGPLREPRSRLAEVTAVVCNGGGADSLASPPDFPMQLLGATFRNLADPSRLAQAAHFKGKQVHALAGIGNPQRFFAHLRALGLDPVCHPFPDHHAYTSDDLALSGAESILMTEKDAVKCLPFADARMWVLPVRAEVSPALFDLIAEKLRGPQTAGNSRLPDHQGPADLR
jgi:tetraacyldisaccharide 4'-kinase